MAKKESLVIEIAGKVNPSLAKAIKDAKGKIDKIKQKSAILSNFHPLIYIFVLVFSLF